MEGENFGAQFLHEKDKNLYKREDIEKASEKKAREEDEKITQPDEKIKAYLERFERVLSPDSLDKYPDFDRKERNINLLKKGLYNNVLLQKENVSQGYWNSQASIMINEGRGNDLEQIGVTKKETVDQEGNTKIDYIFPEEFQQQQVESLIEDQKASLDKWTDYFTHPDSNAYPIWAKYWAFSSMLKLSSYDKEKNVFDRRSKSTVAPFPDLNREALAYVIDVVVKKVERKEDLEEDSPELQKLLEGMNFGKLYAYAIEKVTPTEEEELQNTEGEWIKYDKGSDHMPLVESLQGKCTGWCTAGETTAERQLEQGDFYVYYSYDKEGNPTVPRLAIRMERNKIAEVRGVAQEQNIDPYIGDVLEGKLEEFGQEGERYQKKRNDMQRLTEIYQKNKKEELTIEDLRFIYEMDERIDGFGYGDDPRIKELIEGRDMRKDISKVFGLPESEVSITEEEALEGGIKFHYGDLNLRNLTSAEGLIFPKEISGSIFLDNLASAEGLTLPEKVDGSISLGGLTSAEGLTLPERIDGTLYLGSLTSAEGLNLPEKINGFLYLHSLTSAEGLIFPKEISGSIFLDNLTSAEGITFPEKIDGFLNLDSLTSAEGLILPREVNGGLFLDSLTSVEGLNLPEKINGVIELDSLTSAEGLTFPEEISGTLNLKNLTSAEGLTLPEKVGKNLDLSSLTSVEGLNLPKEIGGKVFFTKITPEEREELIERYPDLDIE